MNFKFFFSLHILLIIVLQNSAQNTITITLQPGAADGKDAQIGSIVPNGINGTNAGNKEHIWPSAWTQNGVKNIERSLIEFDFTKIPANAKIESAKLSLFFTAEDPNMQAHQGNNAFSIQRITSPWQEDLVTWNTKPSTTSENQIIVPKSYNANQNYTDIDVKTLVTDMHNSNNYGFMLQLLNETPYANVALASSDNPNPILHPKLEICYSVPEPENCLTLQPGAADGKNNHICSWSPEINYPVTDFLLISAWSINGEPSNHQTLIEFDQSKIPINAEIKSAKLSLYYKGDNIQNATHQGENAFYIQRVTSPWEENIVTWNMGPTTTTENQILIPKSYNANQNYTDIDVKALVSDMQKSKNYGFKLKLVNETKYARVVIAWSDDPNPILHPKLEICYTIPEPETETITKIETENCLSLQPNSSEGKDAQIESILPDGTNNKNRGNANYIGSNAETKKGIVVIERSLIEFDLSQLPANSTITKANFSLFYDNSTNNNAQHYGNNAIWIQRITSPWEEQTVKWSNKPSTTTENQVSITQSASPSQNYMDIDVLNMVLDMKNKNFGFMLKLQNETPYSGVSFASSDNLNPALHPKLDICYILPTFEPLNSNNCITMQPKASDGFDAQIKNDYSNSNFEQSESICPSVLNDNNQHSISRSLLKFDLSKIPPFSTIKDARLSLYFNPKSSEFCQHNGLNSLQIQRITSSWDKNTVTWNNQPSTSNSDQLIIPQSSFPAQNYTNIYVTNMVQEMVNSYNNHGFLIKLKDEVPKEKSSRYASNANVILCSSNNSDSTLHPKLTVCYTSPTNIEKQIQTNTKASVYPNPFKDFATIEIKGVATKNNTSMSIYNLTGNIVRQLVFENSASGKYLFERKELKSGLYFYTITNEANSTSGKLFIID